MEVFLASFKDRMHHRVTSALVPQLLGQMSESEMPIVKEEPQLFEVELLACLESALRVFAFASIAHTLAVDASLLISSSADASHVASTLTVQRVLTAFLCPMEGVPHAVASTDASVRFFTPHLCLFSCQFFCF